MTEQQLLFWELVPSTPFISRSETTRARLNRIEKNADREFHKESKEEKKSKIGLEIRILNFVCWPPYILEMVRAKKYVSILCKVNSIRNI